MTGDLDPFDFQLAENLGMTVARLRDEIPNSELLAWQAFYEWRAAQREVADKEPK